MAEIVESAKIFPLEIWDKIFAHLRTSQDMITIYRSATVWNELVTPERMWYIMNKSFPFIFRELEEIICVEDLSEEIIICPQWEAAINYFFSCHPFHYDIGISFPALKLPDHPLFLKLTCWGEAKMKSLLNNNNNNNPSVDVSVDNNPFSFTRYFSYREKFCFSTMTNNRGDFNYPRGIVVDLLKKFGSDIWHFDLFLDDEGEGQHKVIRSCIRNLPNVKTVSIYVSHGVRYNFIAPTSPINLGGIIKLSTNLDGIFNYGGLRVNSNLQKLRADSLLPNMRMICLEQLRIKVINEHDLKNLRLLNSPLRILAIDATCCTPTVSLSTIFDAVGRAFFSTTLEKFYLHHVVAGYDEVKKVVSTYLLHLPVLRKLNLKVVNYKLENVDFLLPCRNNLEHISILCGTSSWKDCVQERDPRSSAVINFMGFETSMYDSNVWELFPNLKLVKLEDMNQVYTFTK